MVTNAIREMLKSNPTPAELDLETLASCIAACAACAQSCTACADACLGEQQIDMLRRCIRLNLDCADACTTTERILSRQVQPPMELFRTQLQLCALACRLCAEECEKHAGRHEHCRICARSCRQCEQACNAAQAALAG